MGAEGQVSCTHWHSRITSGEVYLQLWLRRKNFKQIMLALLTHISIWGQVQLQGLALKGSMCLLFTIVDGTFETLLNPLFEV